MKHVYGNDDNLADTPEDPQNEAITGFREAVHSRDIDAYGAAALKLRRWMMSHDPYYPFYHFTGPESWINDPNGPIYYKGKYHLFYQFDPVIRDEGGWRKSSRCWGHAVSRDLVHWTDWPVAIWPDTPQDYGGVYSGNTVVDDTGTPCALYTGNTTGRSGLRYGILAKSRDDMLTWDKRVVMDHAQRPNPDTPVHHDGYIWQETGVWYQLVGGTTGGNDPHGAAFLWTSTDLVHWTLVHNIAPDIRLGEFWELPYLIELGGRYILFAGHGNPYWIGTFNRESLIFTPDDPEPSQIDTGTYYSYNLNMTDTGGPGAAHRQLMHGWVTGPPSPSAEVPYWQGAHSIPRALAHRDCRIVQEPISEIKGLRGNHLRLTGKNGVAAGLSKVMGDCLEIVACFFRPIDRRVFGFKVFVSPNGQEYVRVYYDGQTGSLGVDGPTLDRNVAELTGFKVPKQQADLSGETDVHMRVFIDRSIIEVFVNGYALTARAFPSPDARGIELIAGDDASFLKVMDLYQMRSLWQ